MGKAERALRTGGKRNLLPASSSYDQEGSRATNPRLSSSIWSDTFTEHPLSQEPCRLLWGDRKTRGARAGEALCLAGENKQTVRATKQPLKRPVPMQWGPKKQSLDSVWTAHLEVYLREGWAGLGWAGGLSREEEGDGGAEGRGTQG